MKTTAAPAEVIDLIRRLDSGQLRERLAELADERKAILSALRIALAKRRQPKAVPA
jgi:hypothetical protein